MRLIDRWNPEKGDGVWGFRYPYWCDECAKYGKDSGGKNDAATYSDRSSREYEGCDELRCPDCGSEDFAPNTGKHNVKTVRRYKAWTKPNSDRARLARGEQMLPFQEIAA